MFFAIVLVGNQQKNMQHKQYLEILKFKWLQQCLKYNFQEIFQECGIVPNCAGLIKLCSSSPTNRQKPQIRQVACWPKIMRQTILNCKICSIFRCLDLYPTDNLNNMLTQRLLLEIFYSRFFHSVYLVSDASYFQATQDMLAGMKLSCCPYETTGSKHNTLHMDFAYKLTALLLIMLFLSFLNHTHTTMFESMRPEHL